ncbi:MAG: MATE family efflux transporter [Coriobacteriales bacterium]|nr:MATE family efflux transporter [Coriobacteriales bacterium]
MAYELDIEALRAGYTPTRAELARIVLALSVPAILSELSTTLMQYIDAGMVGSLGAHASASIGLVESTVWLLDGWAMCAAVGFTVLVAQLVGAGRDHDARSVLRQAIVSLLVLGLVLTAVGTAIAGRLPALLGGAPELWEDASSYFFICSLSMVPVIMARLGTGMLQCSGDMRTPSILNVAACVLDVCFNAALIYPSREFTIAGLVIPVPGAGLGIRGAALGTLLAQLMVAVLLLWFACVRSPRLGLHDKGSWRPQTKTMRQALGISGPMLLERTVMSAAYIAGTVIVAPLGTVAVAANSLATTAEAVCYMPGMGMSSAATTLVGQAMGAQRKDLAQSFARISTGLGMLVMACMGGLMFAFAPAIMGALTPNAEVAELGTTILRIEAFAEPLFGASIVGAGALRGAADTFVPSLIVMASMWGVRITAASVVAPVWGLQGVWAVMATELCVRGSLFLVRVLRGKWLERGSVA